MSNWNPQHYRFRKGKTRHDQAVQRVEQDASPKSWLDPESFYKTYETPPSPPKANKPRQEQRR